MLDKVMDPVKQMWWPTTWGGGIKLLFFLATVCMITWLLTDRHRRLTLLSEACVYTVGTVIDHFWQTSGPHFSYHYRVSGKVIRNSGGCINVVNDDGLGCPAVGRKFLVKYSVADSMVSEIDMTKPVDDTLQAPLNGWTTPPF